MNRPFLGIVAATLVWVAAGAASSATTPSPPVLSDQDLLAYDATPLPVVAARRSFVIGTWGGFPVSVDIDCAAACPSGELRIIHLTGFLDADRTCEEIGGITAHRDVPTLRYGEYVCIPRVLWFANELSRVPAFSDAQLLAYRAVPYGEDHRPLSGDVVASYRGALLKVDIECPSACPALLSRQFYLDPPGGKTCADVGGVMTMRLIVRDIGSQRLPYCVPKVILDAEAK